MQWAGKKCDVISSQEVTKSEPGEDSCRAAETKSWCTWQDVDTHTRAHTLTDNAHNSNLSHEEDEGDNPVFHEHFLYVGHQETHHRASSLEEPIPIYGSLQ